MATCPGTLVWFDVDADARFPDPGTVLQRAACDYLTVTSNFNNAAHAEAEPVREGAP